MDGLVFIPQVYLMSRSGEAESISYYYLLALGGYRVIMAVDWLYRFYAQYRYDFLVIVAGSVQSAFYLDLVYLYFFRCRGK